MSATASPGVKNIDSDDTRLLEVAELEVIEHRLNQGTKYVELAAMRLDRLDIAQAEETLGGWPEGFRFPVEAVAAYALLADIVEYEIERLESYKRSCRDIAPRLYWERRDA